MNFVLLIFTFLLAFILECSTPNAGGTADTGNARIAAVILRSDGTPAASMPVVITRKDYLVDIHSEVPLEDEAIRFLSTDDSGHFEIDSIDNGEYVIEVNDKSKSAICFRVLVSGTTDSTMHLNGTLKSYASINGNAGTLVDKTDKRYLLIYGLNRCIPVGTEGEFTVNDLPEGTFDLKIISDAQQWSPVEIPAVVVVSNQTSELPSAGWAHNSVVNINTTSTGALIEHDITKFPLLLRLSNTNFNFNEAFADGRDIRFLSLDSTIVPHEIESWDSDQQLAAIWVLVDTISSNRNGPILYMQWGNKNASLITDTIPVFGNNFLTCFHFNGTINNASKSGFKAIDSNSSDDADGVIAKARKFDGAKSYLSVNGLPERSNGSISFWFRPVKTVNSSTEYSQGIWGKKLNESTDYNITLQGKDFYPDDGNVGKLITKMEDPDIGYYQASTINSFAANIWYHVLWTWGNSGEFLYVNGELENQLAKSRVMLGVGNDEIGRSGYDGSNIQNAEERYFFGTLDEFRMDSTLRSADWVKLSYMNQHKDQKVITIIK